MIILMCRGRTCEGWVDRPSLRLFRLTAAVITSLGWSKKDLFWRLTNRLGSGQERSLVIEKLVEIEYITEQDKSD